MQAAVEPEPGPRLGSQRALTQPILMLGEPAGVGCGQSKQDARRAVRKIDSAAGLELGNVSGEETTVTLSVALARMARRIASRTRPQLSGSSACGVAPAGPHRGYVFVSGRTPEFFEQPRRSRRTVQERCR